MLLPDLPEVARAPTDEARKGDLVDGHVQVKEHSRMPTTNDRRRKEHR
jgi:hypothetical protein